jgi:hypothetical protein
MRVAHDRKRGLIDTLLDAAARHAVLRRVQSGELAWLRDLQAAVEAVRALLEGVGAAAAAREAACGAVAAAAAAAQQRSSVVPDDVFVGRAQQLLQPRTADWAAVYSGAGNGAAGPTPAPQQRGLPPSTPPPAGASGGGGCPAPAFTPRAARAMPVGFGSLREVGSGLSSLAAALRSGEVALSAGLFAEMPRRLGEILAAERRVRGLAFPECANGGGETDVDGAAAPVLTSPALSNAMRALEGLNHSIGGSINRLLQQQSDWATVQKQHAREQQLERRVMSLMFTDPEKLGAAVGELRGRVQGMEAAARGEAAAAVAAGAAGDVLG